MGVCIIPETGTGRLGFEKAFITTCKYAMQCPSAPSPLLIQGLKHFFHSQHVLYLIYCHPRPLLDSDPAPYASPKNGNHEALGPRTPPTPPHLPKFAADLTPLALQEWLKDVRRNQGIDRLVQAFEDALTAAQKHLEPLYKQRCP